MAVTLPEVPENIGETWTNPETGVDYEWNGERWEVTNIKADFDDIAYLSRNQKFTGDLIFNGTTFIHIPKRGNSTLPVVFETGSSYDTMIKLKSYDSGGTDNRKTAIEMKGNGTLFSWTASA